MHNSEKKSIANDIIAALQDKCNSDMLQVRRILRCAIVITDGVIKTKSIPPETVEIAKQFQRDADNENKETGSLPEADINIPAGDEAGGSPADALE